MAEQNQVTKQEAKIWAAVSYLWILSLVVLAARKNNEYVRFHANQGVLLFVLSVIFMLIPGLGWLLNIVIGIIAIVGIIKAWKGEKWSLPVVGGMAKSFGDWIIKTLKI